LLFGVARREGDVVVAVGGCLEDRLERLARAAPRCPKINDDRFVVADDLFDVVLGEFKDCQLVDSFFVAWLDNHSSIF